MSGGELPEAVENEESGSKGKKKRLTAKVLMPRLSGGIGVSIKEFGVFVPTDADFEKGDAVTVEYSGTFGKADFKVLGIKKC